MRQAARHQVPRLRRPAQALRARGVRVRPHEVTAIRSLGERPRRGSRPMAKRMRSKVRRQLHLVRGQGLERFHWGELRRAPPEARPSRSRGTKSQREVRR